MCSKSCPFDRLPQPSRVYIQKISDVLNRFNEPDMLAMADAFSTWLQSERGLNRLTTGQVEFLEVATMTALKASMNGKALRAILETHPPIADSLERDGNLITFPTPPVLS